jgi:DNA-binding transcriptional MerR regulator
MNETDFFLLGDVARILRCQPYQIVYLLTTRQVPEPRLRIGNKRVFTMNDIHRLADKMQVQLAHELVAKGEA